MKRSGPSELGVVMAPGGLIRRPAKPARALPHASKAAHATKAIATTIFIKGLTVQTECGVYAHEMGIKRPLIIDIDITVSADTRSFSDELSQTVDYDILARHIQDVAGQTHLKLIETFAEQVCTKVLTDPRIERVRLRVEKPGSVAGAICSGVEIVRER